MKNWIVCWVLLSAFLSGPLASAADAILDPLHEQEQLIDSLTATVQRVDMARLQVVRTTIETVAQDIENNRKLGKKDVTFQTLRLMQNLIIQYRFSKVFFGWTTPVSLTSIYTEETSETLAKLNTLSEQLVSDYGFDDSPYTQITGNTFRQMQKLLAQAEDLAIAPELKTQLRGLWPRIGQVISIAEQGDRPSAFAKSVPLVKTIRSFYPMFDAISSSQAGFQVILEIQGLNEFYAEFAQVE
jgi:hypothetical protein